MTPHNAAHKISELKRFLYLRISGVSLVASCDVGVTFTLTWLSRRDGPEPPAPNPNVKKLRCFCCNASALGCINGAQVIVDCCLDGDKIWLAIKVSLELLLVKFLLLWGWRLIVLLGLLWREFGDENVEFVGNWEETLELELDKTKDLEGVEWMELTAARYYNFKIKIKKNNKIKKTKQNLNTKFKKHITYTHTQMWMNEIRWILSDRSQIVINVNIDLIWNETHLF